jgi:anti-sigma B factor antagonist
VAVVGSETSEPKIEPWNALAIHDLGDGELRLVGDIDMDTAPALRRCLEGDPTVTVLDLREVTFLDSTGLSVLLHANQVRADGPLILRSPTGAVSRVLELTGTAELFRVEQGQPAAD